MNPLACIGILFIWIFWGWEAALIAFAAYLAAWFFIGVGRGTR